MRSVPKRIPPFRLEAHPLTPEAESAAGFEWASPEVGTRHRIGGEPDVASEPDYPRCRSCRAPMTLYGQLDSIGDDVALADGGVVQVFVCFDCFEARHALRPRERVPRSRPADPARRGTRSGGPAGWSAARRSRSSRSGRDRGRQGRATATRTGASPPALPATPRAASTCTTRPAHTRR